MSKSRNVLDIGKHREDSATIDCTMNFLSDVAILLWMLALRVLQSSERVSGDENRE